MTIQKKILVIEDEKNIREAIIDALVFKNFLVLEAKDGEEGLTIALHQHPDLILLDLIMPKMDGMVTLKKIREDAWGKNVPVIILTNLNATDERIIQDIVTHKPLHYLIKADWKIHDVVKKIDSVLKK